MSNTAHTQPLKKDITLGTNQSVCTTWAMGLRPIARILRSVRNIRMTHPISTTRAGISRQQSRHSGFTSDAFPFPHIRPQRKINPAPRSATGIMVAFSIDCATGILFSRTLMHAHIPPTIIVIMFTSSGTPINAIMIDKKSQLAFFIFLSANPCDNGSINPVVLSPPMHFSEIATLKHSR